MGAADGSYRKLKASSNAKGENDPAVEGVFRIIIQRSLKEMVDLPELKVWSMLPRTVQARMVVRVRRYGFFFTHDSEEIPMRCVLTRRNYLIIYAKEKQLKGYALKLSLAEKVVIACTRGEKKSCNVTIKWRFGEVSMVMLKEQITDWRPRILEAFEGASISATHARDAGIQTTPNDTELRHTFGLAKSRDLHRSKGVAGNVNFPGTEEFSPPNLKKDVVSTTSLAPSVFTDNDGKELKGETNFNKDSANVKPETGANECNKTNYVANVAETVDSGIEESKNENANVFFDSAYVHNVDDENEKEESNPWSALLKTMYERKAAIEKTNIERCNIVPSVFSTTLGNQADFDKNNNSNVVKTTTRSFMVVGRSGNSQRASLSKLSASKNDDFGAKLATPTINKMVTAPIAAPFTNDVIAGHPLCVRRSVSSPVLNINKLKNCNGIRMNSPPMFGPREVIFPKRSIRQIERPLNWMHLESVSGNSWVSPQSKNDSWCAVVKRYGFEEQKNEKETVAKRCVSGQDGQEKEVVTKLVHFQKNEEENAAVERLSFEANNKKEKDATAAQLIGFEHNWEDTTSDC